jgi:hypothetical protein
MHQQRECEQLAAGDRDRSGDCVRGCVVERAPESQRAVADRLEDLLVREIGVGVAESRAGDVDRVGDRFSAAVVRDRRERLFAEPECRGGGRSRIVWPRCRLRDRLGRGRPGATTR